MIKNVVLWIILSFLPIFSQNSGQLKSDLKNIFEISKDYFNSPLNYDSKDFQKVGIISSSVILTSSIDDEIKNLIRSNFDSTNSLLSSFDSYYHVEFMSAAIVGTYIFSSLTENNSLRNLSTNLLSSSLLTTLTTFGIKTLFGRSRPYIADSQYEFNWFEFEDKFLSFPSGHTSLAFSFSTIMAEEKNNFIWKSFWFSAAALVGVSRIHNNKHWFSDVLMGAAIGYFTAKFVLNKNKKNTSENLNLPTNNFVILIRL